MAPNDTKVEYSSENKLGKLPGYLVKGNGNALIVLSEWWGANEQIREQAEYLSKLSGFTTLVPDLYRGKVAVNHEEAGHLFTGLDWQGAVQDIAGSVKYLKEQGCKKVSITGYCMGGAIALAAAVHVGKELTATVPFYGIPKDQLADVTQIKIPVQCHFGTADASKGFSAPEDQDVLEAKLKKGGVEYEFYRYEGAQHAFCHKDGPKYDEKACNLAFERMIAFLKKHMGSE